MLFRSQVKNRAISWPQKHDHKNSHHESGNTVPNQHDETRRRIKLCFMPDGFRDSQDDTYDIGQEEATDAERCRDGEFFYN